MARRNQITPALVYLASPYTARGKATERRRYNEAVRAAAYLMHHGFAVYSPIVHCHYIAKHAGYPTTFEYWRAQDTAFIRKADLFMVLTIPGWQTSHGVQAELAIASEVGTPVSYVIKNPPCNCPAPADYCIINKPPVKGEGYTWPLMK